jgi:CheY-like chemotaxis protein
MRDDQAMTGSVIIVDDDADIREALVDVIADTGRPVFSANDPAGALRLLDGPDVGRPCLVLLDRHLGVTSGGDLLEALRTRPDRHELRVISMSASAQTPTTDEAGVVAFLRKPFDVETLLAVLDEHSPAAE